MFQKCFLILVFCIFFFSAAAVVAADNGEAAVSYLDQIPPGDTAQLFAPGIVSNGFNNRDMAMMPDGSEFYFAVNMRNFNLSTIVSLQKTEDGWDGPRVPAFARDQKMKFLEPAISPDGTKFLFVASQKDGKNNNDIWVMNREATGWGEPEKLADVINTSVSETFPSLTNSGTLYFSRVSDDPSVEYIYRSRLEDGKYTEAERLPDKVNCGKTQFNAFVAPDESYLIVSVYGREDSLGSIDYYIVYRNQQDQWSEPVNLGDRINTAGAQEYSPFVSRDGMYFFFMSTRLPADTASDGGTYSLDGLNRAFNNPENGNSDIYWIDAGFIEELRPEGF